jgi:site-specific recombinase XerD
MNRVRTQPDWWLELSAGYLRSLGRLGRRPNTQRAYSYELLDFGEWLDRAGVRSLPELTRRHIECWQDEVHERKAPRTQQVAACAVRGVLRWAADQDLPLSNPSLWLRVVRRRAPRLKPRPIPLTDLQLIWAYFESPASYTPSTALLVLRTRALFWLIFSSGARISEALSLNRISVADGTALVIQKGGSEHRLMISQKAAATMAEYVAARTDPSLALFVSYARHPFSRLGQQEAQRSWNQLCRDLGIARFTSHQIRHSCATELLRQHIDSLVIAKHMGHRGLGSIEGYAEVGLDSRRLAMEALDGKLAS